MKNCVAALLLLISLSVSAQEIHNEESIKKILASRSDSLNPIEGIWEVSVSHEIYHSDTLVTVKQESEHPKIGIVKEGEKFHTYNLAADSLFIDFIITDVKSVYLYKNYYPETNQYSKIHAVICKSDSMEYTYDTTEDVLRVKSGKNYNQDMREVNLLKWKKTFPAK